MNSMSDTTVYIVQSVRQPRSVSAERVTSSLVRAIADQGIRFDLLTDLEVETFSPPFGNCFFICSDAEAMAKIKGRFKDRFGIRTLLILCPDSFPSVAAENDALLADAKKVLGRDDTVLTDSELSRYVIEKFMSHMRLPVEVVACNAGEELDPTHIADRKVESWSFSRSKLDPSGAKLQAPGLSWSRSEEVPLASPSVAPAKISLDESERRNNCKLVSRLFTSQISTDSPLSVGVLGHKLTFIDELAAALAQSTGSKVELDEWEYLSGPSDRKRAKRLLKESDVIIGEWARPNNVWIQENAPSNTPLIVRAHRYEVTTDFPRAIDMDRFNAAVVIVPWVGRALVQEFGWPAEKMVYIPNFVNKTYFRRNKLDGANFTLGIAGITPHLKRLDLAFDLLAALREIDPRFNLRVRGGDPTKHPHWATDPAMRDQWSSIQARLRFDPRIRNGVHFDQQGRDMASWFQQIGFILSMSDLEGSHVALAEGTVSGAIPVARRWPGIETLWPESAIFDEIGDAVEHIRECSEITEFSEVSARMSTLKSLDSTLVLQAWWHLLNGRVEDAKNVFGPVDWFAPIYEGIPDIEAHP